MPLPLRRPRPAAAALAGALALAAAPACAQAPAADARAAAADPPPVTAFVDVNVVPMDAERVLPGQTVVVWNGRIVAMGPADRVEVPAGAVRIPGNGRYLLPGLAEMHGHVPPPTAPARETEDVLFLYAASGITTVRGMLGAPGQLELRRRAADGEVVSPTLYLAGPSFNGNSVSSPEGAVRMVRAQAAEGWDLLKVHPGLTREEYDAMAREAHRAGLRFGGHVPAEVGLRHALEMGQETFDHLDGFAEYATRPDGTVDEARLAEAVRLARGADAWVVPTMPLWEVLHGTLPLDSLRAFPELRYVSPAAVEGWTRAFRQRTGAADYDAAAARRLIAARERVLRALHEGGVGILMGSDAPQQFSVPGFSLHREFEAMRRAGMTPYQVLATGTRNVGEYFRGKDTFGTVAVGRRADLLLVDGNPLESLDVLRRPAGVMLRGRWLSGDEIRAGLEAIAARHPR